MSGIVERVAKAMEVRAATDPVTLEDVARAAIEAMREPTDEMYIAAMRVTRDPGCGHCADTVGGAAYRAMIDQALKVQP